MQSVGFQRVGHDRATSLSADGGGEAHPCGAFLRPLSMGCTPFPVSFCARDLATWPHTDCTGLGNDHPGQQPPQLSPSPAVNHLGRTYLSDQTTTTGRLPHLRLNRGSAGQGKEQEVGAETVQLT